jgi:hypothetical protein
VETRSLLHDVADHAADWLEDMSERPVRPDAAPGDLTLTRDLGDAAVPVKRVIADLVREAGPGLTAINSPRFFGSCSSATARRTAPRSR